MSDCQLVITGPFGRIDLTHVTDFRDDQDFDGWECSFRLERGGKVENDLFGLLDAQFFSQTTEPIEVWRYETLGIAGTRTYLYPDARLSLAKGGVAFSASGRVRV